MKIAIRNIPDDSFNYLGSGVLQANEITLRVVESGSLCVMQ